MTTPADLKVVAPYLARAKELTVAEPVIAYWCTYYAVQQGMRVGSKDSESNAFLLELMDRLEMMKADTGDNEAVSDDAAAAAYVDNFASKLFTQADNEDRSGKGTRLTAKKFLAAANFLELLSIFGEVDSERQEKIKYSKWKASDIAKAFREGRKPTPGPAGGLPPTEETELGSAEVTSEEAKELTRELAALGTTDERDAAGNASTGPPAENLRSATASATETSFSPAQDNDSASYPFPQQPTAPLLSPNPIPDEYQSASATGSPLLPMSSLPAVPVDTANSTGEGKDTVPLASTPSVDDFPHQTTELPPPAAHAPSAPPAFPSVVFPSAPGPPPTLPPTLPPARAPVQPRVAQPQPLPPPPPVAPTPPASAPAPAPVVDVLDPMVVSTIQKHAKWAISALNYDDVDTARKELRAALAMLGG